MISFTREGSTVKCIVEVISAKEVDARYPNFEFRCSGELEAELLLQKLREDFHGLVSDIRENAYLAGWSDAKSKIKKRDWFRFGLMSRMTVGRGA